MVKTFPCFKKAVAFRDWFALPERPVLMHVHHLSC